MTTVVEEINRIKSMDTSNLNESTATTAIVMPVLCALGWDTTDPDEVHMEYRVAQHLKGYADIALLSRDIPLILIETKAPHRSLEIAKHEIQVLEYCQMKQVRIGVLTNGLEWRIYYLEAGAEKSSSLAETIDLAHGKAEESAEAFGRLLSRDAVSDKRALTHAKQAWHDSILSNLWKDLLAQGDKSLVNRLRKEVKERCHVNIPPDDVRKFIRSRSTLPDTATESPIAPATTSPDSREMPSPPKKSSSVRARVLGIESEYKNYRAVMFDFTIKACRSDQSELENLTKLLANDRRKPSTIMAYGKEKPSSLRRAKMLGSTDYWLHVNLSADGIKKQCDRIRQALSLPEDVLVWLD